MVEGHTMPTPSYSMLMVILLLLLPPLASAAQWPVCVNSGNYTPNSPYESNLRLLSSTLPEKASIKTSGFATGTAGDAPDSVYGLTLCRGGIDANPCTICLGNAFQDVQQICPFKKEATLYYDECMLTFSNRSFLASSSNDDILIFFDNLKFSNIAADYARLFLLTLLNSTAKSAANSTRRFSTSRLDISSAPKVYCAAQCTPDLTGDECTSCLQDSIAKILQEVELQDGGRILGTRCSLRYEKYSFFEGEPMLRIIDLNGTTITVYPQPQQPSAAPPPESTVQEQSGRNSWRSKLWKIFVAAPLLLVLLFFVFVWMRRRRKGKVNFQSQAAVNRLEEMAWRLEEKSPEFTLFDFSQILNATDNFSEDNRLGQGGFGPVYKGQLPDGLEIAVKRLAAHSGQGFTEFKNEVELIAKLQHNNLVRLLGCCIEGDEKILAYEYLPNQSLDFFIFDKNRSTLLDWSKRCTIIEGIAQGLLYLHKHSRLRVIHRDLKASNILLDQDMNPKISDFGLAKIFSSNDTQGNTKRVVGTYGYMSPEYATEGIYSIKSDVFSFGVLLLEILSEKRNSGNHQYGDFLNLLGYVWELWEGGRWLELIESSIAKQIHKSLARRYINIALMCVQENADDRPSISDVIAMLSSESVVLPEPKHPAYFNLRVSKVVESSSSVVQIYSANYVTITGDPEGR